MFPPLPKTLRSQPGFTLAELLISLAILGVIATFTIPKILSSQKSQQQNAAAKEVAATLVNAYQAYSFAGNSTNTMRVGDLTPYMNYVRLDTTSQVDDADTGGALTCGGGPVTCYQLHNGGVLYFWAADGFCADSRTALNYSFDPQLGYSGSTTGSGKAIRFYLYQDSRIVTRESLLPNTRWNIGGGTNCVLVDSPTSLGVATWFSWN